MLTRNCGSFYRATDERESQVKITSIAMIVMLFLSCFALLAWAVGTQTDAVVDVALAKPVDQTAAKVAALATETALLKANTVRLRAIRH